MPAYVIGRPAYDNCLVHMVVSRPDLYGVDATSTIDAVHQVGRDGLKAGHKRRPDRGWNKVRCRGRWRLGFTHLLKHHTIFDNEYQEEFEFLVFHQKKISEWQIHML